MHIWHAKSLSQRSRVLGFMERETLSACSEQHHQQHSGAFRPQKTVLATEEAGPLGLESLVQSHNPTFLRGFAWFGL